MLSDNMEYSQPITLHVDFMEKTITSPSGVMAQGKVYLAGYVEIAPWLLSKTKEAGEGLRIGRNEQQKEMRQGDWPDELLSEVNAITVNLSRNGNNENCNLPVAHMSLHNGHAPQFQTESDMKVYITRIEGELVRAEIELVKLVQEYYENTDAVGDVTLVNPSPVVEYIHGFMTSEQAEDLMKASPSPTHAIVVCECGNNLMVLPGTLTVDCQCGSVYNLPEGWTLDGTIEFIEPAPYVSEEFLKELESLVDEEEID